MKKARFYKRAKEPVGVAHDNECGAEGQGQVAMLETQASTKGNKYF
jgi:hypothetical protein